MLTIKKTIKRSHPTLKSSGLSRRGVVKRDMLKDDGSSILQIFETEEAYIKRRIGTLNEKPKCFLSPLWIARLTLKKYIKITLAELQNELDGFNQH